MVHTSIVRAIVYALLFTTLKHLKRENVSSFENKLSLGSLLIISEALTLKPKAEIRTINDSVQTEKVM